MKTDYSEKEIKMFKSLGYEHLLNEQLNPIDVYRMVVEDCFLDNKVGSNVEDLRRCYKAIRKMNPYRMTKKFDDLIKSGRMVICACKKTGKCKRESDCDHKIPHEEYDSCEEMYCNYVGCNVWCVEV